MTGSGKTLAFVIPILEVLLRREEKLKKMQVRLSVWLMLQNAVNFPSYKLYC